MNETEPLIEKKFSELLSFLQDAGSAVLAFSGGVDSSFLLQAIKMSGIRALAVTGYSETVPEKDIADAVLLAKQAGVPHMLIKTEELSNEAFVSNPPDRCFFCKDELFHKLKSIAERESYHYVFDGSNSDDLRDYRPGRKAAHLHGVRSPLAECGFSKQEIRGMARKLGMVCWDRPSSPCLSSRFPYHRKITHEGLRRVANAEEYIKSLGFGQVRVRDYGDTARIEVSEKEMDLLFSREIRNAVIFALKSSGYAFVSLDLEGYRSGSLNRVLSEDLTNS